MTRRISFLPVLLLLASIPAAATAQTLSINGATDSDNGAVAGVPLGGDIGVSISDPANPGAAYTIVVSIFNNNRTQGWWLEQAGSPPNDAKPIPLVAGVPTAAIEGQFTYNNGSPVDLRPDRPGSPFWRLDSNGDAFHLYRLPSSLPTNVDVHFQVVVDQGASLAVTNGVTVDIQPLVSEGVVTVARGPTNASTQIGAFTFTGDPTSATYAVDSAIDFNIDFLSISLSNSPQYIATSESTTQGTKSNIDCVSRLVAGKAVENDFFQRISIPAGPGADQTWDTSDDLPPRDLYRIKDLDGSLYGFLVVNQGDNPNTPGVRAFIPAGSMRQDPSSPNTDIWESEVFISPNNDYALLAYDPQNGNERAFLMAIDGSRPFDGGTSALRDITPAGDLLEVAVEASYMSYDKVIIAYANNWGSASTQKFYFWTSIYDPADPVEVIFERVTADSGNPVKLIDEDGIVWSRDRNVMAFWAGTRNNTKDMFAINLTQLPLTAKNLSQFTARTDVRDAGDAIDGSDGYMAISENGTYVAYCVETSGEHMWVAATDGSMATQNIEVTTDSLFTHNQMNDVRDIEWLSDDVVLFYFGDDTGTFDMDLYRYHVPTQALENVTMTSGQRFPPYTQLGSIHTKGHFVTQDRGFLIFFRDSAPADQGSTPVNVVGIDLDDLSVFDLTGSEFSGGWVPSVKGTSGQPNIRDWKIRSSAGDQTFYFFTTSFDNNDSLYDHQIFLIDSAFPFAAFPLTSVNQGGSFKINDLTPAGFGPILAYAGGIDETNEDVYIIDLLNNVSRTLTDGTSSLAHTDDSLRFIAPDGTNPAALFFSYGETPSRNPNIDVNLERYTVDRFGNDPVNVSGATYAEMIRILGVGFSD